MRPSGVRIGDIAERTAVGRRVKQYFERGVRCNLLGPLGPLARLFATLDDPADGHLVGEGDPRAIVRQGAKGRPGVLALHGFAGTPLEVQLIADAGSRLEWSVRAPRLLGHDADPRHLIDVRWDDWIRGAESALDELCDATGDKVVVSGLSLGSLLATYLAATYPTRVRGLVVISNAIHLGFWALRLPLTVCRTLEPRDNRFYIRKTDADIREPGARKVHMTYDVNPVKSAIEVLRGGEVVRALLPRVRCPTLIIHAQHDRVCPVANAQEFARGLGTSDVDIAVMPNSGHIVTEDYDRSAVAERVTSFLRRV